MAARAAGGDRTRERGRVRRPHPQAHGRDLARRPAAAVAAASAAAASGSTSRPPAKRRSLSGPVVVIATGTQFRGEEWLDRVANARRLTAAGRVHLGPAAVGEPDADLGSRDRGDWRRRQRVRRVAHPDREGRARDARHALEVAEGAAGAGRARAQARGDRNGQRADGTHGDGARRRRSQGPRPIG